MLLPSRPEEIMGGVKRDIPIHGYAIAQLKRLRTTEMQWTLHGGGRISPDIVTLKTASTTLLRLLLRTLPGSAKTMRTEAKIQRNIRGKPPA